MASKITEDCVVNYGGQLVRLAEGQTVSGNLARFIASTGGPVEPDDTLSEWLDGPATTAGDDEHEDSDVLEVPAGNASRDAWAAYADQEGIAYADDDGRDDIRDAVEAAQSGED